MSEYEAFMLSVCFGVAVGVTLANIIISVRYIIDSYREKRKKDKD